MISRIQSLLRRKATATYGFGYSVILNTRPHASQLGRSMVVFRQASTARQISHQDEAFNPVKWFLLLFPVSAFGLGTWQVQRRQWKKHLIADMKARTDADAIDLPEDFNELNDLEYRPVRVRGEFDHSRELYMGPRTLILDGDAASSAQRNSFSQSTHAGYLVVTPFHLSDRDITILINRGWVPTKKKDPATRAAGQIEGEVEMVGVVRLDEKRAPFMPKNKHKAFYYRLVWRQLRGYLLRGVQAVVSCCRDLQAMAEMTGAAPVFIEATADYTVTGGPVGGQTRVTLRDEHLSYLLTWYGLSATTAFMWYRVFVMKKPLL